MLISKINPPAKKTIEVSPFSSTTEDLNYMSVIARPYIAGSEKTNFQVQFGVITTDENGTPLRFIGKSNSQISLTSDELSTWGTNDEVLLNLIADKLGITNIEFVQTNQITF